MMTAEHRRPFAAFVLVAAFGCLILVDGLRTQVAEVFIGAGAPRQLITVIAPDMVLGESLSDAPKVQTQARPETSREVPSTATTPTEQSRASSSVSVTSAAPASTGTPVRHRNRAHATSSAAPVKTPVKTPVKAPVQTLVKPPVQVSAKPPTAAPEPTPPRTAKPDRPVAPGQLGGGHVALAPSDPSDANANTRRSGDTPRKWKSSSSAPKRSDKRSGTPGPLHGWSGSSSDGSGHGHGLGHGDHDRGGSQGDQGHGLGHGDHDRGGSQGDQGHSHHGR